MSYHEIRALHRVQSGLVKLILLPLVARGGQLYFDGELVEARPSERDICGWGEGLDGPAVELKLPTGWSALISQVDHDRLVRCAR